MGLGGKRGKVKAGEIRPRETALRRLMIRAAINAGYKQSEILRAAKRMSRATMWRDLQDDAK